VLLDGTLTTLSFAALVELVVVVVVDGPAVVATLGALAVVTDVVVTGGVAALGVGVVEFVPDVGRAAVEFCAAAATTGRTSSIPEPCVDDAALAVTESALTAPVNGAVEVLPRCGFFLLLLLSCWSSSPGGE
jgi:hypothetical protein